MTRRLVRPEKGRVLFGVCQGLAEYFEIDPVIVRIIFVILTLWNGLGIIIYIIGIFAIPSVEDLEPKNEKTDNDIKTKFQERVRNVAAEIKLSAKDKKVYLGRERIFGVLIIFLGLIFLFQTFFPQFNFWRLWPVALIIIGLAILIGNQRERA